MSPSALPPHVSAVHVDKPPVVDGRLDDDAWRAAPSTSAFTQKAPVEGAAPTERTTVRIVYDDDAIYLAVDCEQVGAPIVQRLTRRDREVESDWVSVALDTRRDGKSAFVFEVNAGGALLDGVRYNDTDFSQDWDENWEARVAIHERAWSAEYRIPFRILRYGTLPEQSWGLEIRRYISTKQETDEWALVPRSAGGEVSHYGKLDGLVGLAARTPFELRPFVLGRVRRQDTTSLTVPTLENGSFTSTLPGVVDFTPSVGLDIKWHPTQDLTLDAAINPDFAQVESDQIVLNLTNVETYYPEKRPFFLEGTDVFAMPGRFLYTRRIGRVPAIPTLRPGEQLLDVPQPTAIWGASKLTGRIAGGLTAGTLQAVTAENTVPVKQIDGSRVSRVIAPLTGWNVLRLRSDISDRAYVGFTATSVTRAERSAGWPVVPGSAGSPPQAVCPTPSQSAQTTLLVREGDPCFDDAYVAAMDWHWRSGNGDWSSAGQFGASMLGRGPPRSARDGTVIRPGDVGTVALGYIGKDGGEHWVGDVWAGYSGRKFDPNDVGYNDRANAYWDGFDLEYRTLVPWRKWLETHTRLEYWDNANLGGLLLGRGVQLSTAGKLDNFWHYYVGIGWHEAHYDDREMGDGAALERAGVVVGNETQIQSDPTKAVSFNAHARTEALEHGGINFNADAGVTVRALPELDFEFLPTATYNRGEPRYLGTGSEKEYVFGHLEAASIGAVVRTTYAFAPRLTLQAYAQLFLASGHYAAFVSYPSNPSGPRPVVHLADLHPAPPPPWNPDFEQGVLDMNVVLRWEWRLGSVLYFVYTRSQVPNVALGPGEIGSLDLGSVRRAPAADTLILKLSYWWG